MVGLPLFFFEVQTLDPADREELRPLLSLYKRHRQAIYAGYVSPIGDEPTDASWTGFQSHRFDDNAGYLTLFREIDNDQPQQVIDLLHTDGRSMEVTDLLTSEQQTLSPGEGFTMERPGSFKFLSYMLK
jgi:hypothetical protein